MGFLLESLPVKIDLLPRAQKDVRRFGTAKGILLMAVLRGLRNDPNLPSRLQALPTSATPPQFRIDLTTTFVARVRITSNGLLIERVVTVQELEDTATAFFSDD